MPAYFVTATGTDIGKTFVTTALCQQLKGRKKNVFAIKPVITGWTEDSANDTLQILDSLSLPPNKANIESVSPWRFTTPASANLAAKYEKKPFHFQDVVNFCLASVQYYATHKQDYLLIEGAGGVMSPLTDNHTFLDLMEAVNIPVILVCGSYLGSMTHTLTAIEVLAGRNIPIKHIIINESENNPISLADTSETLSHLLQRKVVYLPRLAKPQARFWTALLDISQILDG